MKLTPFAKAFIAVVVVAVLGFATWHYKGDDIKRWAGGDRTVYCAVPFTEVSGRRIHRERIGTPRKARIGG